MSDTEKIEKYEEFLEELANPKNWNGDKFEPIPQRADREISEIANRVLNEYK
jgi:hypothetical protein